MNLQLDGQPVTLGQLRGIWTEPARVSLGDNARCAINESAAQIQKVLASGKSVYGINTGFGQLAQVGVAQVGVAQIGAGHKERLTPFLVNRFAQGAREVGQIAASAVVRPGARWAAWIRTKNGNYRKSIGPE